MNLRSLLAKRQPVAARVAELAALFDTASAFQMARYGPLPESPGFAPLNGELKRQRKKAWNQAAFEKLIRERQATGELPSDGWRPALEQARAAAGAWLFGKDPALCPLARHLLDAAIDRLNPRPEINDFTARKIGEEIARLAFENPRAFDSLRLLIERWHGERRDAERGMPAYLRVCVAAHTLWKAKGKNPTRAELLSACDWIQPTRQELINGDPTKQFRRLLKTARLSDFIKD